MQTLRSIKLLWGILSRNFAAYPSYRDFIEHVVHINLTQSHKEYKISWLSYNNRAETASWGDHDKAPRKETAWPCPRRRPNQTSSHPHWRSLRQLDQALHPVAKKLVEQAQRRRNKSWWNRPKKQQKPISSWLEEKIGSQCLMLSHPTLTTTQDDSKRWRTIEKSHDYFAYYITPQVKKQQLFMAQFQ